MAYRRFKPSIAASESEAQTVANVASVAGGAPVHAVLPTPAIAEAQTVANVASVEAAHTVSSTLANITNKHNLNRYVKRSEEVVTKASLHTTPATTATLSEGHPVDRAAEYHRRRIAAKEADLALRGLGPDGVTPLAEYRRFAAEGAKTAKAALAAGHESLSKITTTPAPTNGPWPEPKITKGSYFGADQVPSRYEPGWRALLASRPRWATELQWETAIFSCRDLFAEWGAELLRLNWRPEDIFHQWHGLGWFLKGQKVVFLGPHHAFLEDGRVFERVCRWPRTS
jgi:hypothetical protein